MDAELVLSLFKGLPEAEMQLMLAELKELYPVAVETLGLSGEGLNTGKGQPAAETKGSRH